MHGWGVVELSRSLWERIRDKAFGSFNFGIFVTLVCALLIGEVTLRLYERHTQVIEDAQTDTFNLTRSLARHAEDVIRTIDGALVGVVERLEVDGLSEEPNPRLDALLKEQVSRIPQIERIVIIDATGLAVMSDTARAVNNFAADREYFQFHRSNSSRELHIGNPVQSRATGKWVIPVTRRVNGKNGEFRGVVFAGLGMEYFQKFYEGFSIGTDGSILLANADGTLLVRRPFREDNIGRSLRDGMIFKQLLPNAPSGTALLTSSTDGVTRINSYQRVNSYPLVIAAAVSSEETLAPWWQQVRVTLGQTGGLILVIAMMSWLISARNTAFRKQAELLNATLDTMHEGLIVVDEANRVSICNRRAMALLDLPEEMMDAQPHGDEVIAYQRGKGEFDNVPQEIAPGLQPKVVGESERVYRRTRPNGKVLEIRTVPFTTKGVIRTYRDITESVRAEEQLSESERKFRLLAENTSDVIVLLRTADNKRLYVSPSIRNLLGYEPEEFMEFGRTDFVHPDDIDALKAIQNQLGVGLEHATSVHRLRHKNGDWIWVETAYTVLGSAEGEEGNVIAVVRDVTERQAQAEELVGAKEAAETATRAKSSFLASMSHELRTPLNGIIGYADLLLAAPDLDDAKRSHIARIQSAGDALLTVVNDVLDFSEIEAGAMRIMPEPFSLPKLIDATVDLLRPIAERKSLALKVDIDQAVGPWLFGDDGRLRQILLNLLGNALKFTAQGSVTLSVCRRDGVSDPQNLRFAVTDTGIGIPADKRTKLFHRFSQVEGSIRRDFGGTGLGLAISKQLVVLMGGEIGCDSEEGAGSTFWFTLALPTAKEQIERHELEARPKAARAAHILLVDDMEMNQDIGRAMLTADGHSVDVVSNGAAAVEAVQAKTYDLVLMDIQMAGMDGITAMQHIRELDHPSRDIPIIAMTANVLPEDVASFIAAGMNDHVGKPFQRATLCAKVARWAPARDTGGGVDAERHDSFRELVGTEAMGRFLDQLASQLNGALLDDAIDADELAGIAHDLVPAGMLGFIDLSSLCTDIEQACKAKADHRELLQRLRVARDRTLAEIAAMRQAA